MVLEPVIERRKKKGHGKVMRASEDNFIRLLRMRKEEGIQYVIETYGGLIRSIVYGRLSRFPDRAEECMNDIFFGIWQNIDGFDEKKGSFINWAAGVARLETIDMLRKIQREKGAASVVPIEDMVILQEDRELLTLVEQEFSEETEQILNCLSSKDRELFRRIFVEEQEPETAGCAMGMSRDNVYVRIFRGKKKIRRKMQSWKGTKVV